MNNIISEIVKQIKTKARDMAWYYQHKDILLGDIIAMIESTPVPENSAVETLLKDIRDAEVEPRVKKVNLSVCDHWSGFHAYVDFHSNFKGTVTGLSTHGDTPEEALETLKNELIAKFGKCPHCHSYRKGEESK